MADIVLRNLDDEALAPPRGAGAAELKKLAADIRSLSAGRPQTPSEVLLREIRARR